MVLKSSTHGKETAEKIPTFVLKCSCVVCFYNPSTLSKTKKL